MVAVVGIPRAWAERMTAAHCRQPILFGETEDVVHLRFDLFRNSWMVRHRFEPAPVPRVLDGRDVDPDTAAWDSAVASLDKAQR